MVLLYALGLALSLFSAHGSEIQHDGSIELHAHLFMKEGMGILAHGDFNGPLGAKDWTSYFGSQANPQTLDSSHLNIVVVSLYAHPLFAFSRKNSIRRQLDLAEAFVATHPDWIIATRSSDAAAALSHGKRVIILALEGAAGILDTDADIHEFIDERGIRIVTLLHLTDDYIGGAAFLKGLMSIASPVARLSTIFRFNTPPGPRVNRRQLTTRGRALAEKLIRHHVWIDLSHASDASQEELVSVIEDAKEPLLYTHSPLRRYFGAERGISDAQLARLKTSRGVLGLLASESMLEGTPVSEVFCPKECPHPCQGSVYALAQQYDDAVKVLGADAVALGTDFSGGITHLKPSCGTGTRLDQEGFWNIGLVGDLWNALRSVGAPVPPDFRSSTDYFLTAWARVAP